MRIQNILLKRPSLQSQEIVYAIYWVDKILDIN